MKPSYYNVIARYSPDLYALYNTHSTSFAFLDTREKAMYDHICEAEGCEGEGSISSDFMQMLKDQQFVVDNPEDEANWLQYEFEKYKHNSRYFELTICPTLDCNFRCPYCYEKKRPGRMSADVQDALMRFVEEGYEEKPFKQLRIVWYGGEPLTQPSVIENLSARFIDFCEKNGIAYQAHLMTNGSLANEEMMERMRRCAITSVQVSFGGKGRQHDTDRVSLDGESTYARIYENACRMASDGFATHVEFVVDRDNYQSCLEVAEDLGRLDNVYFHMPFRKADYNGNLYFEDDAGDSVPMFDYLDAEEIDRFTYECFMKGRPVAHDFRERLTPLHHFCGASLDRFYVVDELGNVYKCICDVDKPETHALFNLCEPRENRKTNMARLLHFANANPAKLEGCRTCRLYPICNGYCYRNNEVEGGDFYHRGRDCRCQTFTYTIEDYVRSYGEALQAERGMQ